MLVIAFDGILFDTLEFRAIAVAEALAAEGVVATTERVLSVLPSLSLAEAVRAAANSSVDETTLDLASLRAERAISELGSRGAALNVTVRDKLRRAAAVTRIVVRADSRRREVDELLVLAELDSVVSFCRCSDDVGALAHSHATNPQSATTAAAGQLRAPPTQLSSVERSYAHIARRMYGNMTLLGTSANIGIALEVGEPARTVARTHGFSTPDGLDAANLPGR